MTLEGDTLPQIQKWWDAIISDFYQYLSTNNIWPPYKSLIVEHHNIYKFLLPPDTHPKYATEKENYKTFSGALRFHILKDNIISSSKATKLHVKLITYMNNDNGFGLIIAVVFVMIPQLGGLGPKSQDLVISF